MLQVWYLIVFLIWSQIDVPNGTIFIISSNSCVPIYYLMRLLLEFNHGKQCYTNIFLICCFLFLEHHFSTFCPCSNHAHPLSLQQTLDPSKKHNLMSLLIINISFRSFPEYISMFITLSHLSLPFIRIHLFLVLSYIIS